MALYRPAPAAQIFQERFKLIQIPEIRLGRKSSRRVIQNPVKSIAWITALNCFTGIHVEFLSNSKYPFGIHELYNIAPEVAQFRAPLAVRKSVVPPRVAFARG